MSHGIPHFTASLPTEFLVGTATERSLAGQLPDTLRGLSRNLRFRRQRTEEGVLLQFLDNSTAENLVQFETAHCDEQRALASRGSARPAN